MAVNDSDKKINAVLNKKPVKGGELEQFNEIQGHITNLQAQQKYDLNAQRLVSGMESQNNQMIAQAAEVLAAEQMASNVAPVTVNPNTNTILNKYGLNKPSKISKTTHNTIQTQTPQRISVTNTTNTTNNVKISQGPSAIPLSSPTIPIRSGGNTSDDSNKFKIWVKNAFSKQNEAAALREKEYRKREWSLSRTTNKLIQKMGEVGKTVGKAMSPKNISNMMGDQLKIVLFLMGFQLMASNIGEILKKVDGFLYWISNGSIGLRPAGGKESTLKSTLTETLSDVFGKNSEFFGNLTSIFSGLFEGLGDRMSGMFSGLGDKMSDLMTARKEAIKQIKFPKIELTDGIPKVLESVAVYLGDIISTALTGSNAVDKNISRDISSSGKTQMMESYGDTWSHTQDATNYISHNFAKNTSLGDAVLYAEGFKQNFKMAERDYNQFGGLANNVGSSVKLSTYLSRGNHSTEQLVSGFTALKKTAKSKGEVLVPGDFLDYLGNYFNIRNITDDIKLSSKWARVRYIVVPKTMSERNAENYGGWFDSFTKEYIENKMYAMLPGGGVGYLDTVAGEFERGNWATGTVNAVFGWNGGMRSFISATGAKWRGGAHDDYTIMMVREDDARYDRIAYPPALDKSGNPLVDENGNIYLVLTIDKLKYIEDCIKHEHNNQDFSFEFGNLNSINLVNSLSSNQLGSDFGGRIEALRDVKSSESRLLRDEGKINALTDFNTYNPFEKDKSETKISSSVKSKLDRKRKLINKLYNKLGNAGLGLSAAQISGLIGNIGVESDFDPGAVGDNGRSHGLCQWNGDRLNEFMSLNRGEKPNKNNEDAQIDFIIHELRNTNVGRKALDAIKSDGKSNSDSSVAAKIWMDNYEKPSEKAARESIDRRQQFAAGAYEQRRQELVNAGITNKLDTSFSNIGGRAMAVYDMVKADTSMQVKFTEDQKMTDGDGNVINGLYRGFIGNTEVNLANAVLRGEEGFTVSSLVMHENLSHASSELERNELGSKWGYYNENIKTNAKGSGESGYYALIRILTPYYAKQSQSSDLNSVYNGLLQTDWIKLLEIIIDTELFNQPIIDIFENYYYDDLKHWYSSGGGAVKWDAILKGINYLTTFLIGSVENINEYLNSDLWNKKLIETDPYKKGGNSVNWGKSGFSDKELGEIFFSNLQDKVLYFKDTARHQTIKRKQVHSIPVVVLENRDSNNITVYISININYEWSDRITFIKELLITQGHIWFKPVKEFLKKHEMLIDKAQLEENNIDRKTVIYKAFKENNDLLERLRINTADGEDAMKNLEFSYSTSRLGDIANLNERNRILTATDLAKDALQKAVAKQQRDILRERAIIESVNGYENLRDAHRWNGDIDLGYDFEKISSSLKEGIGIQDFNQLDDEKVKKLKNLYNVLKAEEGDGGKKHRIIVGKDENGNPIYEDITTEDLLKAKFDQNTEKENYNTQLKVFGDIVEALDMDRYGIDTKNVRDLTELTFSKNTVKKIRNLFGFDDNIALNGDIQSWRDGIGKNLNLKDLARAIAVEYNITTKADGSEGGDVDTAAEYLLKQDGTGHMHIESLLRYGAESDIYKRLIEKRKLLRDGVYSSQIDFSKLSDAAKRDYNSAERQSRNLIKVGDSHINGILNDSDKNNTLIQLNDGGTINLDNTLNSLGKMKYVDIGDIRADSSRIGDLAESFGVKDPGDQRIIEALLTGQDVSTLINNNTIINGKYLEAIAQLLSLIAVNGSNSGTTKIDLNYLNGTGTGDEVTPS